MKHIFTLILFAAPFIMSAQEPVKETKTTKAPPSNEKSISEKGVSSTKGRGVKAKKNGRSTCSCAKGNPCTKGNQRRKTKRDTGN